MAYDIRADAGLGCIFIEWRGRFSAEEVARYYADFAALPESARLGCSLHDGLRWDLDVPMAEIRRAARQPAPRGLYAGPRRVAIVVATDLAFGMMRVLAALREGGGVEIDVFREFAPARDWLGLPQRAFDREGS